MIIECELKKSGRGNGFGKNTAAELTNSIGKFAGATKRFDKGAANNCALCVVGGGEKTGPVGYPKTDQTGIGQIHALNTLEIGFLRFANAGSFTGSAIC